MDNRPLVSIITPSYNQGRFIEDTLKSVNNQDYPNIEHIVVDGKSTDNTLKILARYEKKYNLKWISEPDNGQSEAINKGFEKAKGDFVGWLNSDDIYLVKDAVTEIVKFFNKNPQVSAVYGYDCKIDSKNRILKFTYKPQYEPKVFINNLPSQPTVFLRKKIIEKEKLREDFEYMMDTEYWLRLNYKFQWKRIDKIISGDRLYSGVKRFGKGYSEEFTKIKGEYKFSKSGIGSMISYLSSYMNRIEGLKLVKRLNLIQNNFTVNLTILPKFGLFLNQLLPLEKIKFNPNYCKSQFSRLVLRD